MISLSRSASKTDVASESDPSDARAAAEFLLNFLQFTGLLNPPQRRDDRIEQVQQHQHAILVVMQRSVAGSIALAAVVVQSLEQRRKLVEELEAP